MKVGHLQAGKVPHQVNSQGKQENPSITAVVKRSLHRQPKGNELQEGRITAAKGALRAPMPPIHPPVA